MRYELTTSKQALQATPFFGGLEDGSLDRIIAMLELREIKAGTKVYEQGDTGRSMCIVHHGELIVSRTGPSGHVVRLMHLRAGDFFGETTLIEMQPRSARVVAEVDSVLLELTNVSLYKLYQEDIRAYVMVLQNVNRELCRRLRKTEDRVTQRADLARDPNTQIISLAVLNATRETHAPAAPAPMEPPIAAPVAAEPGEDPPNRGYGPASTVPVI